MLLKEAYHHLQSSLLAIYDNREAGVIADWIMEEITKWSKSQRIIHHDFHLTPEQDIQYTKFKNEILEGKPLQYVLGYSWFKGHKLTVNEHVLIPRPETEELVDSIINFSEITQEKNKIPFRAIDIGTGSGCIAISLQHAFPDWEIWAIDKSATALKLASQNATQLNVKIHFKELDILSDSLNHDLPAFNLIVSNPPYIPNEDKHEMTAQVLDHEPHLALFVTNNDPLQFYKSIISFSEQHLTRGGTLWFETHMSYAEEVAALMRQHEYEEVKVQKDFQGKDRIVSGIRAGASL
ncbi:MAG: peptide chain release factor N(5)-glutamine methyltransferase [Bacteroidota bacterium]